MELPGPALWKAFADGQRFRKEDGEVVEARIVDAGSLVLPTGRIVVADPMLDPWNKPFAESVPAGAYPVLLSLIEDQVALVMVHFAEGRPTRWKEARPGSFSVDSATGALMDLKVSRFLRRKAESDDYDRYSHRFEQALDENDGLWGSARTGGDSGANVVLFRTWGGDGVFPSFFGYTGDSLICLVVDMFLNLEHVVGPVR